MHGADLHRDMLAESERSQDFHRRKLFSQDVVARARKIGIRDRKRANQCQVIRATDTPTASKIAPSRTRTASRVRPRSSEGR
jgi:hypothetical protein